MFKISVLDFWLLLPVCLLLLLGILTLYSLSPISGDIFFKKQLFWALLGIISMLLISSVDYRLFRARGAIVFIFYALSILALIFLFVAGTRIKGVEGWFALGGFLLQPAEFLKISLLLVLAKYFSGRHIEIHRWRHIIISAVYVLVPAILLLLQPDLGSVIVITILWIAIMIFAGIPLKRLAALGIIFLALTFILWNFVLAPYQKSRVISFLNPWADARGGGYQTIQSMIAVGSGEITGAGFGQGTQSHLHFLPEPETDFIFATFAEEWGFAGSVLFFIIAGFLFWRLWQLSRSASDNFAGFFTLGYLVLIFIQFTVHIGANTGLLPITGLTLPFVSYGGSSLLSLFIGLGIIQSIKIHKSVILDSVI